MTNLVPATNIQAAAVAGMLIELLEHFLSGHGYSLPPDMGNALTGLVAVIVAHIFDVLTGGNQPPQQAQAQNGQNTGISDTQNQQQAQKETPQH